MCASRRRASGCEAFWFVVLAGLLCAATWNATPAAAQEEGAPHGLVKHAIFTRVFGKPTIPHIVKFVDEPAKPADAAKPGSGGPAGNLATRRYSSMPILRPSARSAPNTHPVSYAPAMQSVDTLADGVSGAMNMPESVLAIEPEMEVARRTYSYHYPWDYGTIAGSYPPSYFANYGSYLGGYGQAGYGQAGNGGFFGYRPGGFGAYGSYPGYWGGFPYLAAYQPYGYYGNWYGGYRPWGWGGLPAYSASVFGLPNYGVGNYLTPPLTSFGPTPIGNFAGCCYW